MKRQFERLEPRQQRAVAAAAVAIIFAGLAALLLSLHAGNKDAADSLSAGRATLMQVQTLSAQLDALTAGTDSSSDLTALVMETLQAHGLQPSRLQQSGTDELQLRLDGIAFADAVAWLATLEETAGVTIVRVSMTQAAGNAAAVIVSVRRS